MTTTWLDALRADLGARVSVAGADLALHGRDEGACGPYPPEAVVYAESEADVLSALALARRHGVPVTPFAAGSSLEGSALPVRGGISLDLTRMNRVLELDPGSFCATVQPGVPYPELSRQARPHGLFFAVDPGAEASLGGMASTAASGTGAVRYGTMRENVLALKVALPDGRVLRLGSKARKTSAGYDLKDLFIGAEGTLGVITELTVRLHPLPAAVASLRASFEDVQSAVETAVAVMGAGVRPERIELVDAGTVRAVNAYKGRTDEVAPTLWIEVAGRDGADLDASLTLLTELCQDGGGRGLARATSAAERAELWTARHHAYYALKAQHPGHRSLATDICVPTSALPQAITGAEALMRQHGLNGPILGHVGDGNYHVYLHADPDDAAAWDRIGQVSAGLVAQAHALGGTCTGEHGVGLRKRAYLRAEHGDALDLMRDVKRLFDPAGLMNPGKIFED